MGGRLHFGAHRASGSGGIVVMLAFGWLSFSSAAPLESETGRVARAKDARAAGIERFTQSIAAARNSQTKELRQGQLSEAVAAALASGGASVIEERGAELAGFNEDDFSRETARLLAEELSHTQITDERLIFLWGIVGKGYTNAAIERLVGEWRREWPRLKTEGGIRLLINDAHWYAVLAMARQGEPWAIKSVLEFVRSPGLTLQIKAPRLLDDLAWIRQPEGVELLREFVNSDEIVGDPVEELDIACALWVYAADALSKCLEDFPYSMLAEDDSKCIPFNKGGVREFMNSHKGPWRIKGRPWPPKEAAGSDPSPVLSPSAAGSRSHATNGSSESTARGSPPASGSSHGREAAQTAKVVAAVACGLIALTAVGVLLRRRRDRGASDG